MSQRRAACEAGDGGICEQFSLADGVRLTPAPNIPVGFVISPYKFAELLLSSQARCPSVSRHPRGNVLAEHKTFLEASA